MEELDCSGLSCPLPIVQINKKVKNMDSGASLRITATDPAFKPDILAWIKRTGHHLEQLLEEGEHFYVVIRKS